jgi:hypothetical protein
MNEPIHTVDLFHDHPIEGIANFEGSPHHFQCEFDREADEYGDEYCLTPISASTLNSATEKWQTWLRWKSAFKACRASLDTHPALPDDRGRYEQLQSEISKAINDRRSQSFRARAQFLAGETVEWTKIP